MGLPFSMCFILSKIYKETFCYSFTLQDLLLILLLKLVTFTSQYNCSNSGMYPTLDTVGSRRSFP